MAEPAQQLIHRAARIEDAFHHWRERRGRKRGLVTTIVPYTGYGAPGWTRVLCRVVLARPGVVARERVRGWRAFFSIPVSDASVRVTAEGLELRVTPNRGGVVDARIESDLSPGWHSLALSTDDSEPVTAPVFIVDPATRFGIVSDIDDTVMVTALPRPFLAAWNTFVLDEHARTPVAGMAVLYERLRLAHPTSPVLYLSTGAWNVAPTLRRFLERNLYPAGALMLTDWGPTHDRWFRSGQEHKRTNLARFAEEFPDLKWLLIGDDGQHDETLYGEFSVAHPENVAAVAIRQLSTGEAVLAGGRTKAAERLKESTVPWFYGGNGAELFRALEGAGLLED